MCLQQQARILAIVALQLHIADPMQPVQRRICTEAISALLLPDGLPGETISTMAWYNKHS